MRNTGSAQRKVNPTPNPTNKQSKRRGSYLHVRMSSRPRHVRPNMAKVERHSNMAPATKALITTYHLRTGWEASRGIGEVGRIGSGCKALDAQGD